MTTTKNRAPSRDLTLEIFHALTQDRSFVRVPDVSLSASIWRRFKKQGATDLMFVTAVDLALWSLREINLQDQSEARVSRPQRERVAPAGKKRRRRENSLPLFDERQR